MSAVDSDLVMISYDAERILISASTYHWQVVALMLPEDP
jgi:hypothetical protein